MPRYPSRYLMLTPPAHADLSGPIIGKPPGWTTFAVINGTDGDNSLTGTASADTISGLGGNDSIRGLEGDDTVYGGDGKDVIYGGLGFDTLNGGTGDDSIQAVQSVDGLTSAPSDVVAGGGGVDTLIAYYLGFTPVDVSIDISTGSGQVQVGALKGESFSQMEKVYFNGSGGNDVITGGKYDDSMYGAGGNDVLRGGDGNDILSDSLGTVNANGGDGNDTIDLRGSHVYGDTEINANSGIYKVNGATIGAISKFENLTVSAGDGNDTITGFVNGVNRITAGSSALGNKTFTGGNFDDQLSGGQGDDFLYGGGGSDLITLGPSGVKAAYGGDGDDNIYNGGTIGWMYGGAGNDSFIGQSHLGNLCSYDCGTGDDVVFEWLGSQTVSYIRSYLGGRGHDVLQVYGSGGTLDFTAATIDSFEELQSSNDTFTSAVHVRLTSAQFLAFDIIQEIAVDPAAKFFSIALADNGAIALPEISQFDELVLADGGQHADLSAVTSTFCPAVIGGTGDDTVIAPTAAIAGGFTAILGNGKDTFTGGGSDDHVTGGAGADALNGGVGLDTFVYTAAPESNAAHFDTITGFDFAAKDRIDLTFAVTKIDRAVNAGPLSDATFADDLKAALGKHQLKADHAVLFTPDSGNHAGETFLVIDTGGKAGFQANNDMVIRLDGALHTGAIDTADFI